MSNQLVVGGAGKGKGKGKGKGVAVVPLYRIATRNINTQRVVDKGASKLVIQRRRRRLEMASLESVVVPMLLMVVVGMMGLMNAQGVLRDGQTVDCSAMVDAFEGKYKQIRVKNDVDEGSFVFFLHVPRTAGKTYSSCFLNPMVKPSKRCLPSYDRFRLPNSPEGCTYMVSHDDLSVTEVSIFFLLLLSSLLLLLLSLLNINVSPCACRNCRRKIIRL